MFWNGKLLYVIADIHSDVKRAKKLIARAEKKYGHRIGKHDIVLILGDVFGATKSKAPNQYKQIAADSAMVAWCDAQPFTILAIRGNHDARNKFKMLNAKKSTWNGQPVVTIGRNLHYLNDGEVYDIPLNSVTNIKALILGGAFGHDLALNGIPYQLKLAMRNSFAPVLYATEKIKVDFVFSHDCPRSKMGFIKFIFGVSPANDILEETLSHIEFSKWYFGHHHMDVQTASKFSCVYRRVVKIAAQKKDHSRTSRRSRPE